MSDNVILIPYQDGRSKPWRITAPWLKLSLKYGVVGPWRTPNASVAFDQYSLSRGPKSGPPTIGDLAVTTLMNSNVKGGDLALVSDWMGVPDHLAQMENTARLIGECNALGGMSTEIIETVGSLMDSIEELQGIKTAKVAKWFAAWAPAHIPMIDQYVGLALIGTSETLGTIRWATLLSRFRAIVELNRSLLESLGKRLAERLRLPTAIPTVRILDSLIWFDWWACYQYPDDFSDWVRPDDPSGEHVLTNQALEYERA